MERLECVHCKVAEEEKRLLKCAVCHKRFCEDCATTMSGRTFCSQYCAEYFFHGGEEDL